MSYRGIGAAILAALLSFCPAPSAAREWVAFRATIVAATAPTPGLELRGQLIRPAGEGRFPAVVMLHDCRGIRPYQVGWADKLAGWGYVVLIVDSFMTRYDADVCAHLPVYAAENRRNDRVGDALGALAYLSAQPFVDPGRVLIMGWAYDAVLRALVEPRANSGPGGRFIAAVAISPSCRSVLGKDLAAPALVLTGGEDDWTPASDCERLTARAENGDRIELVVYPGAKHGFDDPDLGEPQYLEGAWNPNRAAGRGVDLAYDEQARADAVERVRGFLARHAPTSWDPAYALAAEPAGDERAEWAVDPRHPGPNLPAVGRSTFDRLFSVMRDGAAVYALPFPFESLTASIASRFPPQRYGVSPVKQVLIPMGRSLQRHAAAPDYFEYPRVVVAVDADPPASPQDGAIPLKDRLFLGYQERSRTIEVISYNELAGRFEFQLVKNYGPEKAPEVLYANRAICLSCHQNGGPIFALFPWDETNRNEGVAARLAKVKPRFYGVPAFQGAVPAATIDASTDRASMLPVYQRLWTEACDDDDAQAASRCRAGALVAMLQHRLSGALHFDRESAAYREGFMRVSARRWLMRWPHGLKVPSADLRNREPVYAHPDIPAIFDPLYPRPPLQTWSGLRPRDIENVITGLSEFIPDSDLRRLDGFLSRVRDRDAVSERVVEADCGLKEQSLAGGVTRVLIRCPPQAGAAGVQGSARFRDGALIDGSLEQLSIPGDGAIFQLDLKSGARVLDGEFASLSLTPSLPRTGFNPRLADGSAVTALTLRYRREAAGTGEPTQGRLGVRVSGDFRVVEDAVERMRTDQMSAGADGVFSRGPFRGPRVMQTLFRALGIAPTPWCCEPEGPLPPARAESGLAEADVAGLATVQESAGVRMLHRFCAGCHRGDEPVPPNFLSGDPATVDSRLRQCASRIFYRLSMWSVDADERAVTPMPPVSALAAHGLDDARWRYSPELEALRDYAGRLYESESSGAPAPGLLERDYAGLRACIAG